MARPKSSLPWWLRHLTPAAPFFLHAYLIVICLILSLLLPLIQWLRG